MEERAGMSENGAIEADLLQPCRSWFWVARRLFGLIAPILVLALAVLIYLMFADVPEDDDSAMIDIVIVYGTALLSPMGLIALAGYLCANSTRGNPAPLIGKVSSIINLIFTVVLIVPAVVMLSFFLRVAPTMIPELIAWLSSMAQA